MTRVLIATEVEPGDWTVQLDDRIIDRLTTDEAITHVLKLMSASFPGLPMLTLQQIRERERRRPSLPIEQPQPPKETTHDRRR